MSYYSDNQSCQCYIYISNYKILITFSDGKQQEVNFENFLEKIPILNSPNIWI